MVVADKIQIVSQMVTKEDMPEQMAQALLTDYVVFLFQKELIDVLQGAEALGIGHHEFVELLEGRGVEVHEDIKDALLDVDAIEHFNKLKQTA